LTGLSKDLSKGATGRLNNGVAQVPAALGPSGAELRSFAQSLPIYKMKETIIKTMHENHVFLVAGETGSGKTTQVIIQNLRRLCMSPFANQFVPMRFQLYTKYYCLFLMRSGSSDDSE
jgi:primosomal protein N'